MNVVCCEQCGFPATVRVESAGVRRYSCELAANVDAACAQVREHRGGAKGGGALADVSIRCEASGFRLETAKVVSNPALAPLGALINEARPTAQCPSTWCGRSGVVFCAKRASHAGDHRGSGAQWDAAGRRVRITEPVP